MSAISSRFWRRVGLLLELVELERQPRNRRAQLMGHRVGQLALIGDQAFDARGHQVEVFGQVADVRALGQLDPRRQVVIAKTLGGQAQFFQITPMRAHPEKQHDTDHHRDHQIGRGNVERHQARLGRQLDAEQLRTVVDARDELRVLVANHQQALGQLGFLLLGQGQLIGLDQAQAQAIVRAHALPVVAPGPHRPGRAIAPPATRPGHAPPRGCSSASDRRAAHRTCARRFAAPAPGPPSSPETTREITAAFTAPTQTD